MSNQSRLLIYLIYFIYFELIGDPAIRRSGDPAIRRSGDLYFLQPVRYLLLNFVSFSHFRREVGHVTSIFGYNSDVQPYQLELPQ